jgi:eukaryotic-like serine/threonine-protein kinase
MMRDAPREDGVTQVDEGQPLAEKDRQNADRPAVGEVLAERYRLEQHINDDQGGRQVWRGVDTMLLRPVAVVLRSPGGESAQEMLAAAVTASRVVHPNLIGVYDAIDETTRAYVVREWIEGLSLRELIEAEGAMDADRAITTAHGVAEAVAALHASGMAHGNVHPGTVLLADDGRVVLTDARAGSATPEGDVRAIGGILYYGLTEQWPHREAGPTALPDANRDSGVLAAPRQIRAGVPTHIDDLVCDLLNDQVTLPSAEVLAAELDRLDVGPDERGYGTLRFSDTLPEPAPRKAPRRVVYGVAAGLALAVLGIAIASKALTNGGDPASSHGVNPTSSAAPSTAAQTEPQMLALTGNQLHLYDPQGDGTANANLARALDGKTSTGWKTEHYEQNFGPGGLKDGIGLWLDLGSPQAISDVTVVLSAREATATMLGGTTEPGATAYKTFTRIGAVQEEFGGTNMVFSASDEETQKFQYLLLWITSMPRDTNDGGQRFQIGVQEITVRVV